MERIALTVRSLRFAIAVALAAIAALPQSGYARSCAGSWPAPADATAQAAAVFRGTVVSVENQRSGRTTLQVSTVWKGSVTREMIVYAGGNNFANYYPFQPGTEYVVYANQSVAGSLWGVPEHSLVVDNCTRTAPVSQASADLAALGPGQPPLPALPPTAGQGAAAGASPRVMPGLLVIAGSLLAFLALAWRGRGKVATRSAMRLP